MKPPIQLRYLVALPLLAMAMPAMAQDDMIEPEDDYSVNQLIIYGDDNCPKSTGNEIVVCARKDEGERYRIPENLRTSSDPSNESWTERALSLETNGPYGQHACSPSGTEGAAGCTVALINAAFEERRTGSAVRFSQLIQDAREERLEYIDGDAADEQARVEELENEYLRKLDRERREALPDEDVALPDPTSADVSETDTAPADPGQ